MKTRTKTLALMEIAVVLCSVFLVALPAIAADQKQEMQKASATEVTTASEDDYVLGVYGNANEDDTIDMGDVVYIKLAIFGKKSKTELCDAKYDGRINVLDVIQTKLIILGKEKELTLVDSADRTVTISKPIKRIVVFSNEVVEAMRSLNAADKIVGVSWYVSGGGLTQEKNLHSGFFPEFAGFPTFGEPSAPDYETVLSCNPDLVFLYASPRYDLVQNKLEELDPAITVVRLDCSKLESYMREVAELGYILNHVGEAEAFISFYESFMNEIKDRVKDIPENERPNVYVEVWIPYYALGGWTEKIVFAGGKNVFGDLTGSRVVDPEEVVERDPEIIIKLPWGEGGYDTNDLTELSDIRDEVMARPELANVRAVQNGNVYIISKVVYSVPRSLIGIGYMAKWFHPELFEDLDPKAIFQEYLTRFQGLDIDLDEKGVFVYPEPS